jgi:hypothetical protein
MRNYFDCERIQTAFNAYFILDWLNSLTYFVPQYNDDCFKWIGREINLGFKFRQIVFCIRQIMFCVSP